MSEQYRAATSSSRTTHTDDEKGPLGPDSLGEYMDGEDQYILAPRSSQYEATSAGNTNPEDASDRNEGTNNEEPANGEPKR